MPIPGNLKARDLVVDLKKGHIKVVVKGQDAIIDVSGSRDVCRRREQDWIRNTSISYPA